MQTRKAFVWLVAALLCGCSSGSGDDASAQLTVVGTTQDLMARMIDPAADVYWGAGGVIIDEDGEHWQIPETDEDWAALSNAAYTVAEGGNLMLLEGRAVDQGAWVTMSNELTRIALQALEAADARNLQAVFDMGAEMYYVCTNCHSVYSIGTLQPTDSN
jgi:hypothetical protein